jgi:hypothetical protein
LLLLHSRLLMRLQTCLLLLLLLGELVQLTWLLLLWLLLLWLLLLLSTGVQLLLCFETTRQQARTCWAHQLLLLLLYLLLYLLLLCWHTWLLLQRINLQG